MDVLSVVAEVMAVDPSELRVRRRRSVNRGVAARMLVRYAGLTQREIAGVLGFASSSTVGKQQQRLSGELAKSRKLRRCVQEIEARLTPLRRP